MKIYHSVDEALKAIHYKHHLEVIAIIGINNEAFMVKRSQPSPESYLNIAAARKLSIKHDLIERQVKSAIKKLSLADEDKENLPPQNYQRTNHDPIEQLIQNKYPEIIRLFQEIKHNANRNVSGLNPKQLRGLKTKQNVAINSYKKLLSNIIDEISQTKDLIAKTESLKLLSQEIDPELTKSIKESLELMHAEERILKHFPEIIKAYESAYPGKDIESICLILSNSPCVGDHPVKNKQTADAQAKNPNYQKKASTAKVINEKEMPEGCYEKLKLYFDEHKKFGHSQVEAKVEILYLHKYESNEVCEIYGLFATQAKGDLKKKLESVYSKEGVSPGSKK